MHVGPWSVGGSRNIDDDDDEEREGNLAYRCSFGVVRRGATPSLRDSASINARVRKELVQKGQQKSCMKNRTSRYGPPTARSISMLRTIAEIGDKKAEAIKGFDVSLEHIKERAREPSAIMFRQTKHVDLPDQKR